MCYFSRAVRHRERIGVTDPRIHFRHTVTREVTAIMNTGKSWFQFTVLLCLAILSIMLASWVATMTAKSSLTRNRCAFCEMIAGDGSFTAVPGDPFSGGDRFFPSRECPEDLLFHRQARPGDRFPTMENVMKNIWPRVYGSVAPNVIIKPPLPARRTSFCILDSPVYSASAHRLNFTIISTGYVTDRRQGEFLRAHRHDLHLPHGERHRERPWLHSAPGRSR